MPNAPTIKVCPALGSHFVRDDAHSGRHEALVFYRNVRPFDWTIYLFQDSFVPLSSDRFNMAVRKDDWRPADWVYVPEARMFAPPHLRYNAKTDAWDEVKEESAAPAVVVSGLPHRDMVPRPNDEEHPNSWRARCRREFPLLDSPEGSEMLSVLWNEFKAAA